MKIKTITCHNVYNPGASLQAYALASYLRQLRHDVQIIDYQPSYLRHYPLIGIPENSRFNRPGLRLVYQVVKFPGRLWERLTCRRKKAFDQFTAHYLPLTKQTYRSWEVLASAPPDADLYIAGSDQIWNPMFQNGKDPAFFLNFAPAKKQRISYAASFSVDALDNDTKNLVTPWLKKLDAISVRESSALALLDTMGVHGCQVVDPVFLLGRSHWERLAIRPAKEGYILVYDFDRSPVITAIAKELSAQTGQKIIALFPMEGADEVWQDAGPLEFLGAIQNAGVVLSNSFHATAFSLIYQKEFYVLDRQEKINTRMRNLLISVGLENRLIASPGELTDHRIQWDHVRTQLSTAVENSKYFLQANI